MDRALKMGAVDKTHWNLIAACENADMIILAIPIHEIEPTLKAIREDLKTGCLLIDTAPLKRPVQRAAAEHLPQHVHFIGTNPILIHAEELTAEDASAELFQGRLWALCPAGDAHTEAVRLVTDMIQSLGALPYFLSPEEHDGLAAAAESLPVLLSGALMHAVSAHPSWREVRKMAGAQFERATALPDFEAESLAETVFANRDNVKLWVDVMLAELNGWREALDAADRDALVRWFDEAQQRRAEWLKLQKTGDWEEALKRDNVEYVGFFARMFGGRRFLKSREKKLWEE